MPYKKRFQDIGSSYASSLGKFAKGDIVGGTKGFYNLVQPVQRLTSDLGDTSAGYLRRVIPRGFRQWVHPNAFPKRKAPSTVSIPRKVQRTGRTGMVKRLPRNAYAIQLGNRKNLRYLSRSGANAYKRAKRVGRVKVGRFQAVRGRYVGPFAALQNRRGYDKFRSLGSTNHVEVQGTSTGADTAEIGHSVCMPQLIMQSVGRAILRRMLEKEGSEIIRDWSALPTRGSNAWEHQILYRADITAAAIAGTASTAFAAGQTFSQMADILMNAILVLCTTANDQILLEEIKFRYNGGSEIITLPLRQSTITLAVKSLLTLQNITESHTGGTDDHTNTNDVRSNPITGRCWMSNSNSFIPIGGITEGFVENIADERYGQLGDITGNLTHPKAPNFYQNAKISGRVILQPGQIKKSVLDKFESVSFNKLFRIFRRWVIVNTSVTASGTNVYVGYGPSKMFHFEHMVKNAGDPSVTVGFELNLYVKSYLTYRNKREALRIEGL